LLERTRRLHPDSVLVTVLRGAPVDVAHERRHIGDRVSAEVEMIRMLVHVEREHRDRAGDGRAAVGDALIDEPARARQPAQQNPAGAPINEFASATNSPRQRSTEPKSRASAFAMTCGTSRPSPPRLAKYNSCNANEFSAVASSCFRRRTTCAGVVAGSSASSSAEIAFRRVKAPP